MSKQVISLKENKTKILYLIQNEKASYYFKNVRNT